MTNEEPQSGEDPFDGKSGDDWAPSPSAVIGEVFGARWQVGGYNALEDIERRVRLESMNAHLSETHLWYRGLTLYFIGQFGKWDHGTTEHIAAKNIQMDLLGLGLSSAKVAIDTLLAGYYSVAFSTIRHMVETVLQCFYLAAFPERAYFWRAEPTTENVKRMAAARMKDKLVKRLKSFDSDAEREALTKYIKALFASWELLSAGSHPSGAGLVQVQWPESPGKRQVGGTYERYMLLVGFDHGLFALTGLVEQFEALDRVDEEWRERFYVWREEVNSFRSKLGSDPAVQAFAADLEVTRRALTQAAQEEDSGGKTK